MLFICQRNTCLSPLSVTIQEGVPGDASPLAGARGVLAPFPLFRGPPQAARVWYLSSYLYFIEKRREWNNIIKKFGIFYLYWYICCMACISSLDRKDEVFTMVVSLTDRSREVAEKLARLREQMAAHQLDSLHIVQLPNISWLTAGASSAINLASESVPLSLLITDSQAYAITTNIEAPRFEQEGIPA